MRAVTRPSTHSSEFNEHGDAPRLATVALDPRGSTIRLQRHQHVALQDALGWRIRTLAGVVWITQDYDTRDVVLEPGESFAFDRNGTSLLTPIGQAEVVLESAPNVHDAHDGNAPTARREGRWHWPSFGAVHTRLA